MLYKLRLVWTDKTARSVVETLNTAEVRSSTEAIATYMKTDFFTLIDIKKPGYARLFNSFFTLLQAS